MPVKLYRVSVRGRISKDSTLEEVKGLLNLEELRLSYDEYVRPVILWATEDSKELADNLDVNRVVPKGAHIMGLLGGEKKRGKQEYAGIVVERYSVSGGIAIIKLVNLNKAYQVPVDLMRKYKVGVYKLYYRGLVNPFKCGTLEVLLSARGENQLKRFLREMIEINREVMTMQDIERLEKLIRELRASVDQLKEGSSYVVYRRNRAFTACVPEDLKMATSSDVISYMECKSPEQAHYYTAVLNYLAYKVVEHGRSFIRDQFARPAVAIAVAGLSWRDVQEDIRRDVSALSEQLSRKLSWKMYPNQKAALNDVAKTPEFTRIKSTLDELVDKERLRAALELVSAAGAEEEPED